ncbi:hypothetical protein [Achromobacter sp. 2789STDY5608621]|uniref:hypothetical protein n=1 Tax=Achromobacter sp. 2789STDY5608621 TaxID=1806496 RepID=UPI0006C00403|nr:hypothetical protein [Achromobacter sp. 2789STDY5608621]CUI86160.1 Uncharacterised protein [Achromobacter sp. 2789STDY5608621]
MTTKHTPGQWRITKAKAGVSMGDYVVAIVADERGDRALLIHAEQGSEAEGDANAYLIGAAPELLKAGEEAAGSLSAAMEIMTRLGYGRTANVMQAYHDALVAAIAKAKGEQQ